MHTVYLSMERDAAGGLRPTVWDGPGAGRTEARAIAVPGRGVALVAPMETVAALDRVVDYLWDDERRHFEEQDDGGREAHIFRSLRVLKEALGG